GHAVETDVADTSIFATDGRLRLGERVANSDVSILDGSLDGDFAYQPISSSGGVRQTVEIIRRGKLHSGLGDLFSAERAGSPDTGADRTGSYRASPMPRMSNIRLMLEKHLPLDLEPEAVSPAQLRERLAVAGLLDSHAPTLYLAGQRGGQVAPI